MTKLYIGTCGWQYSWNPVRDGRKSRGLEWYAKYSGLNAVEVNSTHYRTPRLEDVRRWAELGANLRWSIKIHRFISHIYALTDAAIDMFRKFKEVFKEMESLIDFYLLQLPPYYSNNDVYLDRLKTFIKESGVKDKLAVEFRNDSWFKIDKKELCKELDVVLVSVDTPDFTWFTSCKDTVYMRLHGRGVWYLHEYSSDELIDIAREIFNMKPEKIYIFFDNNYWMLVNAKMMKIIMESLMTNYDEKDLRRRLEDLSLEMTPILFRAPQY